MPNHVRNIIKMEGITEIPIFTEDDDGKLCFDFNKLIPMPEYLNIESGSMEEEALIYFLTEKCRKPVRMLQGDEAKAVNVLCKNSFYNGTWTQEVFNRVLERTYSHNGTENEKLFLLGKTYYENWKECGYTSWYDWRVDNWGTKWNSYDNKKIDKDTIAFSTAWSNPEPVINRLSKMYPDKIVEHWWADEDAGRNTGYRTYTSDGINETYYENESNDAFENYIFCWGKDNCLYKDENGDWHVKNCSECGMC